MRDHPFLFHRSWGSSIMSLVLSKPKLSLPINSPSASVIQSSFLLLMNKEPGQTHIFQLTLWSTPIMMPKYRLGDKMVRGTAWICSTFVSMYLVGLPQYTEAQGLD